jgi:hypothetical protein
VGRGGAARGDAAVMLGLRGMEGFFFIVLGVQRRKRKKEIEKGKRRGEKGEFLAEFRAHRAAQNAVQTTLFLNWFGSSIYVQFKVD